MNLNGASTGLTEATDADGSAGTTHPAALGDGTDRRAEGGNQAVENPGPTCGNRSGSLENNPKTT